MKKVMVYLLVFMFLFGSIFPVTVFSAVGVSDYSTALKCSIEFYDANKCGKDVAANNIFDWRGACHTTDGSDVKVDLTGGFHDAGDHVKFGLPQGYAAAMLGWSLYEFKDVFDATGNTQKILSTLKYFTDYFLKSHPNANTFYYQIGEGEADHTYWGAPEEQPGSRPTLYVANTSSPASDILCQTSVALILMYLNYKSIDSTYANKCLQAAKELYSMAVTNPGFGNGQSFYQSSSYNDDIAWAATWLYQLTNDSQYLASAEENILKRNRNGNDPMQHKWTMCWDDMYLPAFLKLVEVTDKQSYKDALSYNLNYWKTSITTTPGGLKYLSNWGVLRYASAESLLALIYYKFSRDESLKTLAKSQIDYILGNNPANYSYVIGMGTKYALHPHHRGANGYTYANGDNAKAAKHLLSGALVGGPDQQDKFVDDVNQFQYTEVAIDYNAAFVGALAGVLKYFSNIAPSSQPSPTKIPSPSPSSSSSPSPQPTGYDGYTVSGYILPDFLTPDTQAPAIKSGFKVEVVGRPDKTVITDDEGYFSIKLAAAPYGCTFRISKEGYLSRDINATFTGSKQISSKTSPISIWGGDMPIEGVQDNAINMTDIMEVSKAFNTANTDSRYIRTSDLNLDNSINMSDIMIVATHFNKTATDY